MALSDTCVPYFWYLVRSAIKAHGMIWFPDWLPVRSIALVLWLNGWFQYPVWLLVRSGGSYITSRSSIDLWRENSSLHVFVSRYFVIESSISSFFKFVWKDGILSILGGPSATFLILFSASLEKIIKIKYWTDNIDKSISARNISHNKFMTNTKYM